MNHYQEYARKLEGLGKTLTGMLGLKLTYIKSKADGVDMYTNYLSSNFFPKKENIDQYNIEERLVVIESALQEYNQIQQEIQDHDDIPPKLQQFLLNRIKESTTKAEIAKRSIYFEAEKSGYDVICEGSSFEIKKNKHKINKIGLGEAFETQKENYLQEIDQLQSAVYGPRISDVEEEKDIILSLCDSNYKKNKSNLSLQEQKVFEEFLERFKSNVGEKAPRDSKTLPSRGTLSMETIMDATEHIKTNFYPDISRGQTKEKGKTGYSSLMSKKIREYPDKAEDNFNKILTTIGHEDAGHMIRSDNQEKNGLIIAGAGYEDIEEGITKLNEGLLKYGLDDYTLIPNDTFIAVFLGENYNFEDTYTLVKILKKLKLKGLITPQKEEILSKNSFELAQRVKCYYPRDANGSNRKDVIYFRGESKLVQYLRSLPNNQERAEFYRKAMSAKVSFEDIFAIDSLLEELSENRGNINQNTLVDKIFNVKLIQGAGAFDKKLNEEGTSNINKNLLDNDFRFTGMQEYTAKEKLALVQLLDMVHYKKYRGKYLPEAKRQSLKQRDLLKKNNVVSVKTKEGWKKGKILSSSLDELKILLQENGTYKNSQIIAIKKKDTESLAEVRILGKNKK